MINFLNIEYLKRGNARQKAAFLDLTGLRLFSQLKGYDPILVGTIPIAIDLAGSDLDIVCRCRDHSFFCEYLTGLYGQMRGFEIQLRHYRQVLTTICRFESTQFKYEIFAQDIPSKNQMAYRHMIVEERLMAVRGAAFRREIIQMKQAGMKTEVAFARLLGLNGEPYQALLELPPAIFETV